MNRTVLIDNSTLSGVQRLTGEAQTLNLNNIDNDILCLEKLVTAILFSDRVISVDDYKEKYRSERLKRFGFVDFIKLDTETATVLSKNAADFASSMVFEFDGSKPAGDVVNFFEALRIDPQLRWDVFVSSEYLTLTLLVQDTKATQHELAIDSVFRHESADAGAVTNPQEMAHPVSVEGRSDISDIKDLVQAFRSGNSQYRGPGHKSLLQRIVFGYGWAAERSHFYNAVAAIHNADAYLAPLRDAFCESCCRIESRSQVNNLLERLKSHSQETLSKIVEAGGGARFAVKLPFFTAYLISQCDNPAQCIEKALELRSSKDFKGCRTVLYNLENAKQQDKHKEINQILGYLEQSADALMKTYAVTTDGGKQFSLSLGLTGPSIGTSFKLSNLFSSYENKPFTRVFRNIAQDMLNVEKLGGLHEKLCSTIREHKKATYPQIAVTPKFMEDKENEYGRPAELRTE
ncbi:MAG: hypothetical protein KF854_17850 [Nitrospira sp.]|nr:hypothetical protein [Nitrospira sp.]MBX3513689.1 hypothetical protein [Xanthobacteraceae bacterium]MCW5674791.1 hypothetical protein [Xanthobacteraceae bacterium]